MPRHDETTLGFRSSADEHARIDEHRSRLDTLDRRQGRLTCRICGERASLNTGCTQAHHAATVDRTGHPVTVTGGALREHLAVPIEAKLIDPDKLSQIKGLRIV